MSGCLLISLRTKKILYHFRWLFDVSCESDLDKEKRGTLLAVKSNLRLLINLSNSCWFTHFQGRALIHCAVALLFLLLSVVTFRHSNSRIRMLYILPTKVHTSAMLSSFGSAQIELRRVEYALSWPFLVDVTFLNEIESEFWNNFVFFPNSIFWYRILHVQN